MRRREARRGDGDVLESSVEVFEESIVGVGRSGLLVEAGDGTDRDGKGDFDALIGWVSTETVQ